MAGAPVILHNNLHNTNQWLGLNLVGLRGGRQHHLVCRWRGAQLVPSRGRQLSFHLLIHAIFSAWDKPHMPIGLRSSGLRLWDEPTVLSTSRRESIIRSRREANSNDLAARSSTFVVSATAAL